jgi:two-component system CheB/CheR fusion protein
MKGDPIRLAQVLTNLFENASKYTEPGGRIQLTVQLVEQEIVIQICDTGIGIVPEMLPHVFDPFWRSSRAIDHSEEGLGVGLALVRHFVEMHGGRITALSAGPGRGSKFIVRLPQEPRTRSCTVPANRTP